ncbi:bifunctional 4-hydroxy-2-oxoglutarate aldolase/2-dehydro-3-deoxy-phosphogluconate aldolase [Litoribrevibacter albus]|uniref:2-dehydro-3-deoxy-phosphogluconate aldolase n=1 Tax=Litoribrevibacter albus TaxID=1473156 RepID=A0AA37W4V3_9GAMM|nr:bifunctional 4-hydroxy-2-oxoglutarate aldolase/2-dehydro-3-deoxy-phosphogluconate aldolase [Litoribrevibacter albus]GLQ30522.1 ketohydroxyglutarate aldolase [Litoribrevibacter albus]
MMSFKGLISQYSPQQKPILPVIVINDLEHAVPLAQALVDGGIHFLEITLRTEHGLEAIKLIKQEVPDACVGAGTVTNERQFEQCLDMGAEFLISPGITKAMAHYAEDSPVPYVPGIATASEAMLAMEHGITEVKFFPAEQAGGVPMLNALAAPFPELSFCPTGGINANNAGNYLSLAAVMAVGGSWVCPNALIQQGQWAEITRLSQQAMTGLAPQ